MGELGAQTPQRRIARGLGARVAHVAPCGADELLERLGVVPEQVVTPLGGTPVACLDLKARAAEARANHEALVADVTLMGPEGCAGVRLGAHVAFAALEERLCVWAASDDAGAVLPRLAELAAASPDPWSNDEQLQALLDEKAHAWHVQSDAAQVVASYLRCHPQVAEVRYPGLKADPSFAVAARTLVGGFGPQVSYLLVGEQAWRSCVCTCDDARAQVMQLEEQLRADTPQVPVR